MIRDVRVNDIVICGNFNCVLENNCDIISGEKHAESTALKLNTVLHDCDLHNTLRLFNPDCRQYTWSRRTPFVARRLDYILTSSGIFDKTIDSQIVSDPMSDHRGCFIHIKFTDIVKGNGY